LTASGIRLGIADERAAAIGRITPELFRANGVEMDAIRANVAYTSVTAPELGQAVTLGHVDAAIVWRPVAMQYPLTDSVEIPVDLNRISPIDAAVVRGGAHSGTIAADFVDFLAGSFAREVFRRHHYDLEAPITAAPKSGSVSESGAGNVQ
jgi:ABC-type molybdate transport system substrate-binding protein